MSLTSMEEEDSRDRGEYDDSGSHYAIEILAALKLDAES